MVMELKEDRGKEISRNMANMVVLSLYDDILKLLAKTNEKKWKLNPTAVVVGFPSIGIDSIFGLKFTNETNISMKLVSSGFESESRVDDISLLDFNISIRGSARMVSDIEYEDETSFESNLCTGIINVAGTDKGCLLPIFGKNNIMDKRVMGYIGKAISDVKITGFDIYIVCEEVDGIKTYLCNIEYEEKTIDGQIAIKLTVGELKEYDKESLYSFILHKTNLDEFEDLDYLYGSLAELIKKYREI